MKTRYAILFAVGAILIMTVQAPAVPPTPVDATAVTHLPDGTPESLRKLTISFAATIVKVNNDANAKRAQLRQHLVDGFDRAIAQAQKAGDLDTILALKEAKEKFDSLDASDVSLVKNAIAFREKKTAEIESARIADALKAAKSFNDELEKTKKAETQKGSIETAMAFSEQQKKVLEWVATLPRSNPNPILENTNPSEMQRAPNTVADGNSFQQATKEAARFSQDDGVKRIDLGNGVSMELIQCPAVGSNFWIGKYEVTQEQWSRVMHSNPSTHKHPKNPVETITWASCNDFVKKLNQLPAIKSSGFVFRLPTGGEWETACRAGSSGGFCRLADGTDVSASSLDRVARFGDGEQGPANVGRLEPNAWGLYDMLGNVWEWTQDEDNRGRHRRKGGCWYDDINHCNAGTLWWTPSSRSYAAVGFRIAAESGSR